MDCSLPDFSIHEIFQAKVLDWIATSFSRGSFQHRNWTWVSCIPGRFFTSWASRETLGNIKQDLNKGGTVVKNLPAMQESQEMQVWSLVGKIPWRREWQPTPVLLPGKSHGQRSLVSYYSPWGRKELDTTGNAHKEKVNGMNDPVSSINRSHWAMVKRKGGCFKCKRLKRQADHLQGGGLIWILSQARKCKRHFWDKVWKQTRVGIRFY